MTIVEINALYISASESSAKASICGGSWHWASNRCESYYIIKKHSRAHISISPSVSARVPIWATTHAYRVQALVFTCWGDPKYLIQIPVATLRVAYAYRSRWIGSIYMSVLSSEAHSDCASRYVSRAVLTWALSRTSANAHIVRDFRALAQCVCYMWSIFWEED